MKVLHLTTGLSRGGAEASLFRLLESSDRGRFDPVVLSLMAGGVYAEKIADLGIPAHELAMRPGLPSPRAYLRLRRIVQQVEPDLIHGWMYHGALAGLMSCSGRPVVVAIHHALHDFSQEKLMTKAVILGLRGLGGRAARIAYVSQTSRIQHEGLGYPIEKGIVIPNGFDCSIFRPEPAVRNVVRAEFRVPSSAFVVGHIGRFHTVKNHADLITAFAGLRHHQPSAHLLMAGKGVGPENIALGRRLDGLGLRSQVHLLGERDDVPRLLNAFDVLVNPSLSEAFPNVLGEAMACGVPCIATDVGDSAMILGNTGFVVPPRNLEALSAALSKVADMSNAARLALGGQARARICHEFSSARNADEYGAMYEDVLCEHRSGNR